MEKEIEKYLLNVLNHRIKVEVVFIDFRKYQIKLKFSEEERTIDLTYDFNFNFNTNMIVLMEYIKKEILNYYINMEFYLNN